MASDRVISGTKALSSNVVVSASHGGATKIRHSCGGYAVLAPDGKGGVCHICEKCKVKLVTTPM